ncbi:MAG: PAS domain S-box protein [Candidatus Omnitrophica bacterium]|nr:PAS domain S-box protein [Candidatus Omnitrophota bacterium]
MPKELKLLIVEDNENDALLMVNTLQKEGYEVSYKRVETEPEMRKALTKGGWDAILADYKLPTFSGLKALEIAGGKDKVTPFVIVSGTIGEAAAVNSMKAGADDYVDKDTLGFLVPAVEQAIKSTRLNLRTEAMRKALLDGAREWNVSFNALHDAVCLIGVDRKIKRCNRTMAEMFSVEEDILTGANCCDLVHKGVIPEKECPVHKALFSKRRETSEFNLDGKWVSITADPVLGPSGQITDFVHTIHDITDRKKAEDTLLKRTHDLGERVKELKLLYEISRLVERPDASLDEIFRELTGSIPSAWQYPDITCCRITFRGREFTSSPFRQTKWNLTKDINVFGKKEGSIEVFYLFEKPRQDEGPFLKEERELLNTLSAVLERAIEKKQAEEQLKERERLLGQAESIGKIGAWEMDIEAGGRSIWTKGLYDILDIDEGAPVPNISEISRWYPPEYREELKNKLEDTLRKGKKLYFEAPFRTAKGNLKWGVSIGEAVERNGKVVKLRGTFQDITERKRTEEALIRSERRFKNIVERSYDVICLFNRKGEFKYVSPSVKKITGYTPAAITGTNFSKYIPTSELPRLVKAFNRLLDGENITDYPLPVLTKEGKIIYAEANGSPVRSDGKITGAQVIFRDITERKKAVDALKQSEQRFKSAVLDSPFPMAIHGEDGEILQISRSWTDLSGYTHKEIPTIADWTEKAYGKRKKIIKKDIDKLYALKKRVNEGEYTITTKSGEERIWDFSSAPLGTMPDGRRLILSVANDVTERKKAKKQFLREMNFSEKLITSLPGLFYFFDEAGRMIRWNKRLEEVSGYPAGKIRKMDPADFFDGKDKEAVKDTIKEVIEKGESSVEADLVSMSGERLPHHFTGVKIDMEGRHYVLGTGIDITERKRAEEAKQHLVRNVTHGLKTPIAVSQMALHVCRDNIERSDMKEINESIDIVSRNLKLLSKDIDTILTSTTVDMRKTGSRAVKERSSLKAVVKDILRDRTKVMDGGKIRTKVDIEEKANKIKIDRRDLRILLNCLIGNAVKFTEKGSISITARLKDRFVEIRVKDTGCGISKDNLDRVFDKFYKRHPAVEGTGLGLSISKDISEMYNGQIRIESPGRGKGTTAVVRLPKG